MKIILVQSYANTRLRPFAKRRQVSANGRSLINGTTLYLDILFSSASGEQNIYTHTVKIYRDKNIYITNSVNDIYSK